LIKSSLFYSELGNGFSVVKLPRDNIEVVPS